MSEFIKKFKVLKELREEFLNEIKIFHIFTNNNVLIVERNDKVFSFGSNRDGFLGFGNNRKINELTLNKDLSYKQIIDFKNGACHVIARTIDGQVYCWGDNDFGVLGNGKNSEDIYKPKLNKYLSDKQIIDICCGERHSLALTNSGEVYAWGDNELGQIGNGKCSGCQFKPIKVNGIDEKVIMISCGYYHSMALTESGRVLSWGSNDVGQLGYKTGSYYGKKPSIVLLNKEISIKKISSGREHSLLLSNDGDIYWFGKNGCEKQKTPTKLIINENKFIDIASHCKYFISIALSNNGIYYIWGKCGEEKIIRPKGTHFISFYDIFNHYFGFTYKTLNLSDIKVKTLSFSNKTVNIQVLKNGKYDKEFEEMCLIGCGSFGIVFKAVDRNEGIVYAIKKIPLSDSEIETVSKELNISSKMKEDFVVKIISCWVENNYFRTENKGFFKNILNINNRSKGSMNEGISYSHNVFDPNRKLLLHIQMELCFKTMKEIINEELKNLLMTPLGYYIASEMFIELLECVQYLHKQNIIHRDLKPENILITNGKNGRFIKLGDFWLSTFHEFDDQSHTQYSGSFNYMAPEVRNGRNYDTKADIYSLGVIIRELFDLNNNIVQEEKNTDLEMKFSNLKELNSKMKSNEKEFRPNCDEILSEREKWILSSIDIKDVILEQNGSLSKESFKFLFINKKLKL
jgi:alpha-tubulin suppressor-like RCC1 family protein